MGVVPSNCLTRRDLQALATKSASLAGETSNEALSELFLGLCRAAAAVAGFLSDVTPHERLRDVLEPSGYGFQWREQAVMLHTIRGVFRYSFGEQHMIAPSGASYETGRYRLLCGKVEHLSTSKAELRPLAERYLQDFEDVIPAGTRDASLNLFFDPTEGNHAV